MGAQVAPSATQRPSRQQPFPVQELPAQQALPGAPQVVTVAPGPSATTPASPAFPPSGWSTGRFRSEQASDERTRIPTNSWGALLLTVEDYQPR